MGDSNRSLEDKNAIENVGSKDCTHEVSDENKVFIVNDLTDEDKDFIVLGMEAIYFPFCPGNLSETELNTNELINLAKEISIQCNIQAWELLLLTAFSQVCFENPEGKREIKT